MSSNEAHPQWPSVGSEELPWDRSPDDLELVPKSARRRITPNYTASIPLKLVGRNVELPRDLGLRIDETLVALARLDAAQALRGYDLPALLLRSESAASSQIENLTSSVRNVALAEVSPDAPLNARVIAGNVEAMRRALASSGDLTIEEVLEIHRALMARGDSQYGGELREEQVWVGGTAYSPHGALYVAPAKDRVPECMDDLVAYAKRDDVNPIVQAAVVHAQLETIHPFIDGNGRTGRTLLHRVLRDSGVLQRVTLPISAGLLHNITGYMDAIRAYQQGDPLVVVEQLVDALEVAMALGNVVAKDIDEVIAGWESAMTERKGSSIWRLPGVLVEQPVVNVRVLSERLGITPRAAVNLVGRACAYGMLRPMGNRRRGEFYQSDALIEVLEEASSMSGVRRMLAGGR